MITICKKVVVSLKKSHCKILIESLILIIYRFPFNELGPEAGAIKRHSTYQSIDFLLIIFIDRFHTGYAFSEEERENRFRPGRGHDHPQN